MPKSITTKTIANTNKKEPNGSLYKNKIVALEGCGQELELNYQMRKQKLVLLNFMLISWLKTKMAIK